MSEGRLTMKTVTLCIALCLLSIMLWGCPGGVTGDRTETGIAHIRVGNFASDVPRVYVWYNDYVVDTLQFGDLTGPVPVYDGEHDLAFSLPGSEPSQYVAWNRVAFHSDSNYFIALLDSGGVCWITQTTYNPNSDNGKHFRVANFVPDAPPLRVYFDDCPPVFDSLQFGSISAYDTANCAWPMQFTFVNSEHSFYTLPDSLISVQGHYTIVFCGRLHNNGQGFLVFLDSLPAPTE
jgi:hypothetical protein